MYICHIVIKSRYQLGGGGGAKDLEYHLVGRINVNKILHDKPTYGDFKFNVNHFIRPHLHT